MFIEYKTWHLKLFKWREELVFQQRFRNEDDHSEAFIKKNIQSMIESIVADGDDVKKN